MNSTLHNELRRKSALERFVYYINERFSIRQKRLKGLVREKWTDDAIFQTYKFTNVKRDWDFTTQWLIKNWYTDKRSRHESAGMAAVFARFFCYVPTLEAVGFPSSDVTLWLRSAEKVLTLRARAGEKVFTSAYMIAGGGAAGRNKVEWVINDVLKPVHKSHLLRQAWDGPINTLHTELRTFSGFGDFLTQECVLDLQKTFVLARRPEEEKTMYGFAGPGAMRGLDRLFRKHGDRDRNRARAQDQMIYLWATLRDSSNGLHPQLRRELTVHDVEFNLCEFDKYERVLWGQGTPKQKFVPRENHDQGQLL